MQKRYIKKLKTAIDNGTLIPVIKHAVGKRVPVRLIKNSYILDLQVQNFIAKKIRKRYNVTANIFVKNEEEAQEGEFKRIIWWCWLQGYDQAPELVKSCYESLEKNMSNYEIRILTEKTISQYVNLPQYIIDKYKSGVMGAAHYSDILRLEVLYRYGGVWVDSTVFCTDNKMDSIFQYSSLFVYQDLTSPDIVASNWLISARPNNRIISLTRKLLLEYWKDCNVIEHYYLFHLLFKWATEFYQDEWKTVHRFTNVAPHILVDELDNEFSSERMEEIKRISSFHKLNYKRSYTDNESSFYSMLIKQKKFKES